MFFSAEHRYGSDHSSRVSYTGAVQGAQHIAPLPERCGSTRTPSQTNALVCLFMMHTSNVAFVCTMTQLQTMQSCFAAWHRPGNTRILASVPFAICKTGGGTTRAPRHAACSIRLYLRSTSPRKESVGNNTMYVSVVHPCQGGAGAFACQNHLLNTCRFSANKPALDPNTSQSNHSCNP